MGRVKLLGALLGAILSATGTYAADTIPAGAPDWTWEGIFPLKPRERVECIHICQATDTITLRIHLPSEPADNLTHLPLTVNLENADGQREYRTDIPRLGRRNGVTVKMQKTADTPNVYLTAGGHRQTLHCSFMVNGDEDITITSADNVPGAFYYQKGELVQLPKSPFETTGQLERYLASSHDGREGIYTFLDRESRSPAAILGGEYSVAVVRADIPGQYILLYLDGASHNAKYWKPLQTKGLLTPTGNLGSYDVAWVSADGRTVSRETNADFDIQGILTIRLPLLQTNMRFVKR